MSKSLEQRARAGWMRIHEPWRWDALPAWMRAEWMERAAKVLLSPGLIPLDDPVVIEFADGVLDDRRSICDAVGDFIAVRDDAAVRYLSHDEWREMVGGW